MSVLRVASYNGNDYELYFSSEKDHIGRQVAASGTFYEVELLAATLPLLRPGSLVADIGANVGNHAVFYAAIGGADVIAFEPVAVTLGLLRRNISVNELADQIEVRSIALGERASRGSVEKIVTHNLGATQLRIDEHGAIQVSSLDEVRSDLHRPIGLLKIDVEGMELDVVAGAREVLSKDHPIVVCECATADSLREVYRELQRFGYEMVEVFNATATYVFFPPDGFFPTTNVREGYYRQALVRSHLRVRLLSEQMLALRRRVESIEMTGRTFRQGDKASRSRMSSAQNQEEE